MWPRQTHCGRSTSSATLDPDKFDCMQILTNNKCQKSLEYLGLNLTSLLIEQLCTVHHLLDGIIQYLTHLTLCAIGFRRHDMARYRPPWPMATRPHLTSCFSGRVKVCPVTKLSLLDQERPQPAVESVHPAFYPNGPNGPWLGWLGWLGSPLQSPHGIVMAVKSKKTCAEGLGPMRNNFEVEQKRLGEPKDMARMQNISYIEIYRKKWRNMKKLRLQRVKLRLRRISCTFTCASAKIGLRSGNLSATG